MFDIAPVRWTTSNRLPLCARYLVVVCGSASWQSIRGKRSRATTLNWAIGALADGELDLLGAWLSRTAARAVWTIAAADIQERGVEQIRVLVAQDARAVAGDFPGKPAIVCPSASTLDADSRLGLTVRQRRIVDQTERLTDGVNATVLRGLSQWAPVDGSAGASRFVARALAQAQLRINSSSDVLPGMTRHHGGRLAPSAAATRRQVMAIDAQRLGR